MGIPRASLLARVRFVGIPLLFLLVGAHCGDVQATAVALAPKIEAQTASDVTPLSTPQVDHREEEQAKMLIQSSTSMRDASFTWDQGLILAFIIVLNVGSVLFKLAVKFKWFNFLNSPVWQGNAVERINFFGSLSNSYFREYSKSIGWEMVQSLIVLAAKSIYLAFAAIITVYLLTKRTSFIVQELVVQEFVSTFIAFIAAFILAKEWRPLVRQPEVYLRLLVGGAALLGIRFIVSSLLFYQFSNGGAEYPSDTGKMILMGFLALMSMLLPSYIIMNYFVLNLALTFVKPADSVSSRFAYKRSTVFFAWGAFLLFCVIIAAMIFAGSGGNGFVTSLYVNARQSACAAEWLKIDMTKLDAKTCKGYTDFFMIYTCSDLCVGVGSDTFVAKNANTKAICGAIVGSATQQACPAQLGLGDSGVWGGALLAVGGVLVACLFLVMMTRLLSHKYLSEATVVGGTRSRRGQNVSGPPPLGFNGPN